jgi:subtilisin family serine protease
VLALSILALIVPAAAARTPIVIAIVDSGVDPASPRLVSGHNVFTGSADTHDEVGHGTGVARAVAAGIADCEPCRVMPVKIDSAGSSTQAVIAAGISWAADHGARVINLSWGLATGARSTGEVERAIAVATAHGALVVPGAMNDGSRDPRVDPWASDSPEAVRVTAVDGEGNLLPASNHGVWVDIGAAGTASSNAAPRVAAAAALVLDAHPNLTPAQLRGALRRGCRPAPGLDVGWHCVLDPDGAVRAAASKVQIVPLTVARRGPGLVTGGAIECGRFCADWVDAETMLTLKATPFRGRRFVRWHGRCTGTTRTCRLLVRAPTRAVAVFAP